MKNLLSVFFISTLLFSSSLADSLYLMPEDSKQAVKEVLTQIKEAKKSIKIAIYSFTRNDFAKELKNAAKRGVDIEIIFDKKSNQKQDDSQHKKLAVYNNIKVYLLEGVEANSKKYKGKLHQKLMIIDDKMVFFGSANWSYSAFSINYENLYLSQQKDIVEKFVKYFDEELKKSALRFD